MRGNILIIDDEISVYEEMNEALIAHNVFYAESLAKVNQTFSNREIDLAIVDLNIKVEGRDRFSGLDYIKNIRRKHPWIAVVAHSSYRDVDKITKAIRNGADEYFYKGNLDLYSEDFREQINQLINQKKQKDYEREKLEGDIIGVSSLIEELRKKAKEIAQTRNSFFLIGENGLDKENVLNYLHRHSMYMTTAKPWKTVNLALWKKKDLLSLMRREKGHKKQHFLKKANKSILYVKYFGEADISVQEAFLEMADSKCYLGTTFPLDIQYAFDLNDPPQKLFEKNNLSPNFYPKINQLYIPALRERLVDLPHLIDNWFDAHGYEMGLLNEEIAFYFERYSYPGNHAELYQLLEEMMEKHKKAYSNYSFEKNPNRKRKLPLIADKSLPKVLFNQYVNLADMEEEVAKLQLSYIERALQIYKGKKGKVAEALKAKSVDNLKKTYIDKYDEKFPALIRTFPMIVKCYKLNG